MSSTQKERQEWIESLLLAQIEIIENLQNHLNGRCAKTVLDQADEAILIDHLSSAFALLQIAEFTLIAA